MLVHSKSQITKAMVGSARAFHIQHGDNIGFVGISMSGDRPFILEVKPNGVVFVTVVTEEQKQLLLKKEG